MADDRIKIYIDGNIIQILDSARIGVVQATYSARGKKIGVKAAAKILDATKAEYLANGKAD
ncbi:hypothetical protein E2562_007382 [Oryza meyeriana var. granulata]|uniref:Uncharacterized protein n=1 Tax=Oryza meyeriana var. granulata TaxID=110450 RepID=A0A6G1D098_9ORYZ|nr:hypothetical protein E2562_007382 [Oryza meyeriana var. granulata]